jgi:sugar lactone lactonase YvrE
MKKIFILINLLLIIISCSALPVKTFVLNTTENNEIVFVKGMSGCENLLLLNDSNAFYVTDLSGYVYMIDGTSIKDFKIIKQLKLSDYALGIDIGKDGYLYVGASVADWINKGGPVYRINKNLDAYKKITDDIPGLNGLTIDNSGNIYIATGNMKFGNPKGAILKIENNNGIYGYPEIFIPDLKSANGLYFNPADNCMIFTEVFNGVKKVNLDSKKINKIFGKTRIVEGFDDVCIDKSGNYWVADQPNGFIKMYDPKTGMVYRFIFKDIGIASSCRIRIHNDREYLYVTEIKTNKNSNAYDGRGIIIIPVDILLNKINL